MGTLYNVDGTTGSITTAGAITSTSTTSGFQPPSMTTTQRNAIPTPTDGLIVYDTTLHQLWEYQNGAWAEVGGGGGTPGGSSGDIQFNNAGAFGGSPNLVWDNTNTRLGIGVTPITTLDVNGTIQIQASSGGVLNFGDLSSSYISVGAPSAVTPYSLVLPAAQGTGALTNDGAGNWSWNSSATAPNVVQFTDTTPTSITSTSSSSPTATPLTVTITPSSVSSRVKVTVSAAINWTTGNSVWISLLNGSTVLPANLTFGHIQMAGNTGGEVIASFTYVDSPATTSATTYTFAAFTSSSGAANYSPESEMAVIIAEEIFA
jgi:hypothetical protein